MSTHFQPTDDHDADHNHHRSLIFGNLFGGSKICPPQGFDALKTFDLESYISASWFIPKQNPLSFQPVESLFCVRAEYIVDTYFCLFCNRKPRIRVSNSSKRGGVNGEDQTLFNRFFRGIIRNPQNEPAKASVGFVPDLVVFGSNYWVVAAGTYADILKGDANIGTVYEWAIVTAGSPTVEGANGKCKPDPGLTNVGGMWMFVRDPIPPEGVVDAIETYASVKLGLDTSIWVDVPQEGCVYSSSILS